MADTGNIRQYSQLPPAAQHYIQRLEEICDCPAKVISVGPKREQTIIRQPLT